MSTRDFVVTFSQEQCPPCISGASWLCLCNRKRPRHSFQNGALEHSPERSLLQDDLVSLPSDIGNTFRRNEIRKAQQNIV